MKKRVIIGIVCALLGLLVVFWLGPIVNTASQQTVDIIRLRNNITQGTEITINDLEVVSMSPTAVPAGIINDVNQIVGKYAASDLFAGDYLSATKLAGSANNAEAVFATLDGSQVAISVPITFQGSVSGKLENGDIVRVYVKRGGTNEYAYTPESLQYVRVITVTTSGGIDQDERYYNEDGSYEMPTTATLLVSDAQACDLVELSNGATLYLALVCPGDSDKAQEFLDLQNAMLEEMEKNKAEENEEGTTTPVVVTPIDPTNPADPAEGTGEGAGEGNGEGEPFAAAGGEGENE